MPEIKPPQGEPYYRDFIAKMQEQGPERLGLMTSWAWIDDPRRLTFTLSRYKFVAKMLEGADHVLEVGCGDGFGTRIVAQAVQNLTAVDFDPALIESAKATAHPQFRVEFRLHDLLAGPVGGQYSGIYSLDVLEHIDPNKEEQFLANMMTALAEDGVCIIGTPSLESQAYASHYSKLGHINCKEQPALKALMARFFKNVFMFSMNDEMVHTGYSKMSHYSIALCCAKR